MGVWQTVSYDYTPTNSGSEDIGLRFYDNSGFSGSEVLYVDDFTIAVKWMGTTDNDWMTITNWNGGTVPNSSEDVVIPAGLTNYPTITSSSVINVKSITIESGATVINNGTVVGSNVTYKRTLTNNWHLVAPPINNMTMTDFVSTNNFANSPNANGNIGVGTYNNDNTWTYQNGTPSGNLAPGSGLSVKLAVAGDITFKGSLTGTVDGSASVGVGATTGQKIYNLLGNPFPAFITSDFLNDSDLQQATLWLWNPNATPKPKYETKVATDNFKIAPGQGFFVQSKVANGSITFPANTRSHETTDTFMRNSARPEIHLTAKKGTNKSLTKLYYIDGTTKGFDNGYDGTMFGGTTYDFAVFTHLLANSKGKNYAIQSLPTNYENLIVPVGLIAKANDEITFSAETMNLPSDITVYLEDRTNGVTTNLSEENYKITLGTDANGIGQFYLHTTSRPLSTTAVGQLEDVSIYKSANSTITIAGLQAEEATINVYSILGKKVFGKTISSNGIKNVNVPQLANGIYIVKVNAKTGKISKKITW